MKLVALGGGQLPVLEVGDKKLTQSKAIYRYLGRKFKLAGADDWESAKCDELVDAMEDVVTGEYSSTHLIAIANMAKAG